MASNGVNFNVFSDKGLTELIQNPKVTKARREAARAELKKRQSEEVKGYGVPLEVLNSFPPVKTVVTATLTWVEAKDTGVKLARKFEGGVDCPCAPGGRHLVEKKRLPVLSQEVSAPTFHECDAAAYALVCTKDWDNRVDAAAVEAGHDEYDIQNMRETLSNYLKRNGQLEAEALASQPYNVEYRYTPFMGSFCHYCERGFVMEGTDDEGGGWKTPKIGPDKMRSPFGGYYHPVCLEALVKRDLENGIVYSDNMTEKFLRAVREHRAEFKREVK